MRVLVTTAIFLCGPLIAGAQTRKETKPKMNTLTQDDVRAVSPALDRYAQDRLAGDLWKRPGLSTRDRSIVTVAVLIARNQPVEMSYYSNLALDSGVKPAELSEIITHLAFYSGWGNAMSAVAAARRLPETRSHIQTALSGLGRTASAR